MKESRVRLAFSKHEAQTHVPVLAMPQTGHETFCMEVRFLLESKEVVFFYPFASFYFCSSDVPLKNLTHYPDIGRGSCQSVCLTGNCDMSILCAPFPQGIYNFKVKITAKCKHSTKQNIVFFAFLA